MKRIRVVKDKNFTTINNEFIFNKNMSLKAKGLLCHLLALPNDWKLYVEEVTKWHKDGKASIYSSFKELMAHKYLERRVIRHNGKILEWEYIVYEKPLSGFQEVEKLDVKNQPLLNTDNNKDLLKPIVIYKQDFQNDCQVIADELEFNDLTSFMDYWTEKSVNAKKCRWEKQTSFDIKRRMQRWMKTNKNTKSKVQSTLDTWQEARNLINKQQ